MNNPEKTEAMPSEEDYEKISSGLDEKISNLMPQLLERRDVATWRSLLEAVLARLIVFNGKRGNDVAQMTLQNYNASINVKHNLKGAIFASLTAEEKSYAKDHFLIRVRGKRNRVNDVIVTNSVREAMELLIKMRKEVGVLDTNQFVFAIPYYSTSLNSSTVMKKFIDEFGVANMETRMIRKFLATIIQAKPGTVTRDQLARHLGHDEQVHKEFYRSGLFSLEK
jgi:hypothetical protein